MNQTLIPSAANSVTYTPPPPAAKPAPKELAFSSLYKQPAAPAPPEQFGWVNLPVVAPAAVAVHLFCQRVEQPYATIRTQSQHEELPDCLEVSSQSG